MTDTTELAQRVERIISDMKLKHGGSDTYAPIMKWGEFLALVEALEHYKSREERVTKLVIDNSKSWNELYQQVEAKDKRNAELVEALEKAQRAGNINNQWKPDACPITGRRFFMWIEHPELGYVPTYGGPYDSYTIPTRDGDGEFSCERYDHDVGGWVDGECVGVYLIDDDEQSRVYELEQRIAELEPINAAAEKLVRCKGRYHSELNYRALAALFGVNTPDLPPLEHENVHYADAAEMEIAALRQRIAELESRTVKLPALPRLGDNTEWYQGFAAGAEGMRSDCAHAMTAAGIKWEAE